MRDCAQQSYKEVLRIDRDEGLPATAWVDISSWALGRVGKRRGVWKRGGGVRVRYQSSVTTFLGGSIYVQLPPRTRLV